MSSTRWVTALGIVALPLSVHPLAAQGYSLRFDMQAQTYAYRGVTADSVGMASVVTAPDGSQTTADGKAVTCIGTTPGYCDFFSAGSRIQAVPLVARINGNLWGLGVPGLRFHVDGRIAGQAGDRDAVAGTTPGFQLLEALAEYSRDWLVGRLGRQAVTGRLGYTTFDGGLVEVRNAARGLGGSAYLGRGTAQSTFLQPGNPILNPLGNWQPSRGKTVAGADLSWSNSWLDARADYQREVDNDTRNFVSERVALSGNARLGRQWSVSGGADYDLSYDWWGSADLTVRYAGRTINASGGVRRYRPFFDLWSIWGAFSPTPYNAANGALSIQISPRLEVRGNLEYFWYGNTATETPLVVVVDNGWRGTLAAGYRLGPQWTADASAEFDRGPGAAANDLQGGVRWTPRSALSLGTHLGTLSRPLEFRYNSAGVFWIGVEGSYRASPRLTLNLSGDWLHDRQNEPDLIAFSWSQLRLSLQATWFLNSRADMEPLPRGLPRRPPPQ